MPWHRGVAVYIHRKKQKDNLGANFSSKKKKHFTRFDRSIKTKSVMGFFQKKSLKILSIQSWEKVRQVSPYVLLLWHILRHNNPKLCIIMTLRLIAETQAYKCHLSAKNYVYIIKYNMIDDFTVKAVW